MLSTGADTTPFGIVPEKRNFFSKKELWDLTLFEDGVGNTIYGLELKKIQLFPFYVSF